MHVMLIVGAICLAPALTVGFVIATLAAFAGLTNAVAFVCDSVTSSG